MLSSIARDLCGDLTKMKNGKSMELIGCILEIGLLLSNTGKSIDPAAAAMILKDYVDDSYGSG